MSSDLFGQVKQSNSLTRTRQIWENSLVLAKGLVFLDSGRKLVSDKEGESNNEERKSELKYAKSMRDEECGACCYGLANML